MGGQRILLAMAGKRSKAKRRAALANLRTAVAEASEPDLRGVAFASQTAEDLAVDAGLSWQDFYRTKHTGCTGFTAQDVRTLIAEKDDA